MRAGVTLLARARAGGKFAARARGGSRELANDGLRTLGEAWRAIFTITLTARSQIQPQMLPGVVPGSRQNAAESCSTMAVDPAPHVAQNGPR